MRAVLDHKGGWLCARLVHVSESDPVVWMLWYPILRCRRSEVYELIGEPCEIEDGEVSAVTPNGLWVKPLKYGLETTPLLAEPKPVDPPKRDKGKKLVLAWSCGMWWAKYKKGWQPAK